MMRFSLPALQNPQFLFSWKVCFENSRSRKNKEYTISSCPPRRRNVIWYKWKIQKKSYIREHARVKQYNVCSFALSLSLSGWSNFSVLLIPQLLKLLMQQWLLFSYNWNKYIYFYITVNVITSLKKKKILYICACIEINMFYVISIYKYNRVFYWNVE